ncbi:MAG: MmgE/PrpD family protein, partial [Proteobacteria bacterium]|nr:MmgE/PrpD family protein [Pseudomonadota bacterium]
MDYTKKLAEFCSEVSYHALPQEIVTMVKLCVLDYVANVYGSLELDAVAAVISYIKSLGTQGGISVLGCGFKTDLHNAAFINGTTAEAIEAHDGVRFGGNHPGTAVIPAALAVAENLNLDGKRFIEAIVAGYEAANRPSAAMHPWHTLSGFLPTGTCGTFGAAVAAGRLQEFDAERMASAIGNAAYVMPISTAENLMGGYTVKIVQGGQAASAGLMAAGLAAANVTGAPYIIEGSELNGGFAKITTAVEPKLDRLVEGLGEHYSIMDVYFKPYTACRHTHGAAQATLEIQAEKQIALQDIEKVDVHTYGIAKLAVGKEVTRNSTFVSAQFSIPYVVAVCLTDGELAAKQLTERRIADSALIDLSTRVEVFADDALEEIYPERTSSRVEIILKDGSKIVKQVDIPKGDPRDPMKADD